MNNRLGYSNEAWDRISDKDKSILMDINPVARPSGTSSYRISRVEQQLEEFENSLLGLNPEGGLILNPDFQRGHVWSTEQQISFIENFLRGSARLVIKLNDLSENKEGDLPSYSWICIDGLQRLTALRDFMGGKFKIFDEKYGPEIITEGPAELKNKNWEIELYHFKHRKDILEYYLSFNSGGTVHSPEELNRVRQLLKETQNKPQPNVTKRKGMTP